MTESEADDVMGWVACWETSPIYPTGASMLAFIYEAHKAAEERVENYLFWHEMKNENLENLIYILLFMLASSLAYLLIN